MKKATAAILLLIMLSAFPLAGCESGNITVPADTPDPNKAYVTEAPTAEPTPAPTPEPTPEPTEPPFVYPSAEPLEINVYSMEELIYRALGLADPVFWDQCNGDNSGVAWNQLEHFMKQVEYGNYVPAFRETENYEYVVFDTDEGYRIFVHVQLRPFKIKTLVGFPILLNGVHSYSDFASLKAGDHIDAVAEIDPVAAIVKTTVERKGLTREGIKADKKWGRIPTSFHYLTDGVLRIEYDMDDAGELFIRSITYSEDYTLESKVTPGTIVNYRILPCDLPPAWQEVMGG